MSTVTYEENVQHTHMSIIRLLLFFFILDIASSRTLQNLAGNILLNVLGPRSRRLALYIADETVSRIRDIGDRYFDNSNSANRTDYIVSFVNGIYYSPSDLSRIEGKMAALLDRPVSSFYYPSSGWWINDATYAGYVLFWRPQGLKLALELSEHLRRLLKKGGRHCRVLHIAHSGGAIATYLAAKYHLSKEERSRIDVITFGAGKSISRKYFSGRVVNYYSRSDPLLFVDSASALVLKNSNVTSNASLLSSLDGDVMLDQHNTTYVFLHGSNGSLALEHSLEGPTYSQAIAKEGRLLQERIASLRAERNLSKTETTPQRIWHRLLHPLTSLLKRSK